MKRQDTYAIMKVTKRKSVVVRNSGDFSQGGLTVSRFEIVSSRHDHYDAATFAEALNTGSETEESLSDRLGEVNTRHIGD